MFNFFKRSKKGSKDKSKNNNNKDTKQNNQQLLSSATSSSPQQQSNSTKMYFNRDTTNTTDHHSPSQQQQENLIAQQNTNNSTKNRNLFINKPKKNFTPTVVVPPSTNYDKNNKISNSIIKPSNENSTNRNFHNNNYNNNNNNNYCQTNRAPLLVPPASSASPAAATVSGKILENKPKINTKNFENFINNNNSSGSRNEFVDQRKRFNYNAADDLAAYHHPATNTIASTKNDSYSTSNYDANRSLKSVHLNNNNNKNCNLYKSDYFLDDREKFNSIKFNNPPPSISSSVVDDLSPLPSSSLSYKNQSDNKNLSDINNIKNKKSVKFFNPIDKSRDFLNNIMAKGRQNRNKNNDNNNNQYNQQQNHQVIMSESPSSQEYYPTENKIYNSKGIASPIFNNNNNQNQNYNQNNENDLINIGYQITRSKNSPDIFKKIHNSHNFENSDIDDDDDENDNNQNIFLNTSKHNNLQRRGEADGSDTNIINNNNEYKSSGANSNNFHRYRNNNDEDDDQRDWRNTTPTTTDTYEIHPPVFSKRMPPPAFYTLGEENGKEIRKQPKSILKKNTQQQQQHHQNHQWNNNNSVTKSLSNEQDRKNNIKKKYVHNNNSSLNQLNLNNNDEIIDKIEKLSELTECDRDCFINNNNNNQQYRHKKTDIPSSLYMKMGQSQAKTPTIDNNKQRTRRSRSISPPPTLSSSTSSPSSPNLLSPSTAAKHSSCDNSSAAGSKSSNIYKKYDDKYELPPIITEPLSPTRKNQSSSSSLESENYQNIPLPKITVDDFSKRSSNTNKSSTTSPTDSESSDIYYDFDASPPARSPPRYPTSPSPPTPTTFLEDIVEEDENDDQDDDWHFVSNKDIDSTSTSSRKQQSPKDLIFTSDMSSSTSSSSSASNKNINKDYLKDNFIDHAIDSDLHDSGFISPSNSQSGKILIINSCDLINDRDDNEFLTNNTKLNTKISNYNSDYMNTTIINNNNNLNIFEQNDNDNDIFSVNHILIDSISLPDVVVESKIAADLNDKNNNNLNIPEFISGSTTTTTNRNQQFNNNNNNNDINKSHSMGSVHFIPIHIEANENEDKIHIEEIKPTTINDDQLFENDNFWGTKSSTNENDNLWTKPTNDNDNLWTKPTNDNDNLWTKPTSSDNLTNEKRDLINQEATFNTKLEEAEKTAYNAEQKANELQSKINDLEIDLSTKSWNIERLEAELESIYKEDDSVRKRLKFLEKEKENLKEKFNDKEEELNRKYEILEQQYQELEEKYQKLRTLASTLQTQLAAAQSAAEECRLEKNKLCEEKDAQLKFLQDNLDLARQERQDVEEKWQKDFEILRNQNQNREDNLLTDCEWKLRTMQKNCKDKIDKAEKIRNETMKRAETLEELVQSKTIDESRFKNLQAEVRQLRGLTNDQGVSLNMLHNQIEDLRAELEATNTELELQIEEVLRIKLSCQQELEAKDRETIQKIYDATQELADIWEHKLLTEMTRLTHELETVHVEERLDDMNKLQTEHIEELKVLTTRYTENEEELREQVGELKDQLRSKCDVAFTTRMTLDRADREYQIAMSREEEKRELIIEQLQKDFVQEKLDMEESFRVRLSEVKNEFAKELANTTEDIAKRHRQQLEQQWDQLVADKEEALQALESRHRIRIEEQEAKIRELAQCHGNLEVQHQRDMKDLKNAYDLDRSSLQTRDINNAQEIDQLHRKCRCLTNLFEEMRMRYERREPRQDDLREIAELRSRCESQERDLCLLTEQLRDMQIKMEEMSSDTTAQQKVGKKIRKPPPKSIPTNCDVIYEENEDREQSPIQPIKINDDDDDDSSSSSDGGDDDEDEDEHNDDEKN